MTGSGPEAYEHHLVPAIFAPWAAVLLELARLQPGERVLDAACGTGVVARAAMARVGTAGKVTGVDLNPGMLEVGNPSPGGKATWKRCRSLTARSMSCCVSRGCSFVQTRLLRFPSCAGFFGKVAGWV
jgi:SAM-dependent methyltransferase